MSDQAAAAGQVPAIKRVYVRAWLEPDREYVHPPFSGDLLPIIFDEPSDDDELLPRLTWMRREDVIEAAAAGPVPAEAVEAALVAYSQDPREVPAMQAALAAAAPLIAANRDANIERLKGAIKALDNGLAQHGEHIERLTASERQARSVIALHQQNGCGVQLHAEGLRAEVDRLTAELQAAAESIQARDHIITALQAKIRGDFPGGPQ